MDILNLRKDGHIESGQSSAPKDPLACLGLQVAPAPDFTLRSFFLMVERYPVFKKLNAFFPALFESYDTCPDSGCTMDGIDGLVLGKTIEMIGFPGDPRLETYRTFTGRRNGNIVEIKDFQLEHLLDINIRLGSLKHVIFGDTVDVFKFDTVFTLFEFIDGIGWELGFHGTPMECQIRR